MGPVKGDTGRLVRGDHLGRALVELAPGPRGRIVKDLLDDDPVVAEGCDEQAPVDVVVVTLVDPVLFDVLPDEGAVWGAPRGLDQAQIGADDVGLWVLSRELDGPDSGSCALRCLVMTYVFVSSGGVSDLPGERLCS